MLPRFRKKGSSPASKNAPEADKNFGLTEAQFNDLLADLREGDERLFEHIYLQQFDYCVSKLRHFDGLDERDAYDATIEGLIRCRELLLAGKLRYGNLRYLFVTITRQTYRKEQRRQLPFLALNEWSDDHALPESTSFTEQDRQLLERAYRSLGRPCRQLLQQVYFKQRKLRDIAADGQQSYAALRQQKSRCVKQLRKYYALHGPT